MRINQINEKTLFEKSMKIAFSIYFAVGVVSFIWFIMIIIGVK
jgi:hypothetical protein